MATRPRSDLISETLGVLYKGARTYPDTVSRAEFYAIALNGLDRAALVHLTAVLVEGVVNGDEAARAMAGVPMKRKG